MPGLAQMTGLEFAPRFDTHDAARLARELFGISGNATRLTSERDQNFLIETPDGVRAVLKVANAAERVELLEAQQRALGHIAPAFGRVPNVLATTAGGAVADVAGTDGRRHLVWAVTHLPGTPLAQQHHRTTALLEDLGAHIGELRRALSGFDHPAIHRELQWDLARGLATVAQQRALVDDPVLGGAIDASVARVERDVAPLLPSLRTSAIHGDLNDNNVLVGGGDDLYSRGQHVVGIVDFGDMVHSYAVGDLAIAAAYVALRAADPLAAMASLVRGHHSSFALTEPELAALFGLVTLRLAMSACIAARQREEDPANEYLYVDQAAIRRVLPALARIPTGVVTAIFRDACGLEPVRSSARVRAWLAANTATFAPVLGVDLRTEPCTVLDLGVGSPLVDGSERRECGADAHAPHRRSAGGERRPHRGRPVRRTAAALHRAILRLRIGTER